MSGGTPRGGPSGIIEHMETSRGLAPQMQDDGAAPALAPGSAGAGARSAGVGIGPRSDRERRWFEMYCRWGMHALLLAVTGVMIMSLFVALPVLEASVGWASGRRALLTAAGVLIAVCWAGLAIAVTEVMCREITLPRWLRTAFTLSSVLAVYGLACLMPGAGVHEHGVGPYAGLGPMPLAATAAVAALSKRVGAVVAGAAGGMALLALVLATGPAAMSPRAALAVAMLTGWIIAFAIPTGLITRWMIDVVRRLWRAQQVAADLAVAEERLRISRDLHDVFGRTLSTVAVKSELAAELARLGEAGAREQMLEVREIAQNALTDVRGLVRGYRAIDLADEVAGARSLLRAAGVTAEVRGLDNPAAVTGSLAVPALDALAWGMREGVTNVLRHGRAGTVSMSLTEVGDQVELLISNPAARSEAGSDGTGLVGLRERAEAAGGTLTYGWEGGRFGLRLTVPTLHS